MPKTAATVLHLCQLGLASALFILGGVLPVLKVLVTKSEPDNKVVRVNLWPTAAVQQDARVPHYGAASVVLVLHGRHTRQKVVEHLGYVRGAVTIKDIVNDVPWLERALQDRDVPLWIKKSENILSEKR